MIPYILCNPSVTTSLAGHDWYKAFRDQCPLVETVKPGIVEIDKIFRKCITSNWGGQGEVPIGPVVYEKAKQIVNILSDDLQPFSISPEEDGSIAFEWYRNPGCIVWASVNPDGNLYYAALVKGSREKGAQPLSDSLYDNLSRGMLSAVRRVVEANE